jgi:hypothetical protein
MYLQTKRYNKFNNHTSVYNNNYYDSIKEADYAQELDLRVRAKDIKSWRRQIPIELKVGEYKICTYILDFEITHNDKTIEFIEIKGFETAIWRLKKKLFEAIYLPVHKNTRYTVIK